MVKETDIRLCRVLGEKVLGVQRGQGSCLNEEPKGVLRCGLNWVCNRSSLENRAGRVGRAHVENRRKGLPRPEARRPKYREILPCVWNGEVLSAPGEMG